MGRFEGSASLGESVRAYIFNDKLSMFMHCLYVLSHLNFFVHLNEYKCMSTG